MDDIIYFELNNWSPDDDYPDAEPYLTWLEDDENIIFIDNEQWVKDNKLCVAFEIIDQSLNFCITATKKWVEENCPHCSQNIQDFFDITQMTVKYMDGLELHFFHMRRLTLE